MNTKRNKKGFTIVELVIVIAVIGILSAILIPTFVNLTKNAKETALKSDLQSSYSMYIADAADGKVGDNGVALEMYAQEEVGLAEAKNATEANFYTFTAANGWNLTKSAAPSGYKYELVFKTTAANADPAETDGFYGKYYVFHLVVSNS